MYGIMKDGVLIGQFDAPLTLRSNQPIFGGDSLSLKRTTRKRAAQRWEIRANIEPLVGNANELFALLVTNGSTIPYTVMCPQNYGAILARKYVMPVTVSGNPKSSTITLSNNVNTIPVGTMIQFENHTKVYMVNSLPDAERNVKIFPPLVHSVVNETLRWREDVMMLAYMDLDQVAGMVYTDGIVMDIGTVNMVEKL
jgi:hypothetical protein